MAKARPAQLKINAGGALLARLKALGVDYLFANSGTDFPPIIEGLAEAQANGAPAPAAIIAPHENAAMGMAHGYYFATGRAQAVMTHTNVGLANCAMGAINANVDNVAMLMFSGRTPTLERGRFGARNTPIGWGQEMRDQHALIREACKWDYELRFPEQVLEVADRAHAIAHSTPRGPVYVSLPREVLCEECDAENLAAPPLFAAAVSAPNAADLARAAALIAQAERPVVIAMRGPQSEEGFAALAAFVETWALPVVQYRPSQLVLATDHPMMAGTDPGPWIKDADLIIALDALTPWVPDAHGQAADCPVIHIGPNPLFERTPIRNYRVDVALAGELDNAIPALANALAPHLDGATPRLGKRRSAIKQLAGQRKPQTPLTDANAPITKAFVGAELSRALGARRSTIFSELGVPLESLHAPDFRSFYGEPLSGGLGLGFPAALGFKLAQPDRFVVATMGDGCYIFANPVACHQIAEAYDLPILILVLNNAGWGAVRNAVQVLYPEGLSVRANAMPLTEFAPTTDFSMIAAANRAWAKRVERRVDLAAALAEAINVVENERRVALLDIAIAP